MENKPSVKKPERYYKPDLKNTDPICCFQTLPRAGDWVYFGRLLDYMNYFSEA